jgi:hypothetical protein
MFRCCGVHPASAKRKTVEIEKKEAARVRYGGADRTEAVDASLSFSFVVGLEASHILRKFVLGGLPSTDLRTCRSS